ncbi:magnesium transporter [Ectothiorhodospira marina]|uniref:Magnesium transporter MgtE n=2 Tax=Ectothiorhodospira marina TaxID=1396821 RepID=A0A1H7HE33_9GAMM|nr:magnesium transporter [Ectothiorhodospira marina]
MDMIETISPDVFKAHLENPDPEALGTMLDALQDQDLAALTAHLEPEAWGVLIRLLPDDRAPDVFSYLTQEQQQRILQDLTDEETSQLLRRSSYDDTAALIDSLPDDRAREVMDLLPDRHQWVIKSLLAYPEESAGRRMTPGFLAVRPHWTLEQALDHLRREFEASETVNVVFVTDGEGRLLGAVKLKELLVGSPRRRVDTLLREDVVRAQTRMDQEKAASLIRHYDLEVLPVVDERDILVGIITVDDVMDVATEETTEDFLRMGSVGVGSTVTSLRDVALGVLYRKRVGWLLILIFVNMVSGAAISLFEQAIETVVALVFFLPLVIATGGNAGTQASTLMVRSLATGDVQLRDGLKLWGKELFVSIALGGTLGLAVWGAGIWLGGPQVGLAVAIAMVLVVIVGSMLGLMLPLLLTRLNMDPATASAPLVTSIADVGGILVYFGVATLVLQLSA